jgi:hypothetical protein
MQIKSLIIAASMLALPGAASAQAVAPALSGQAAGKPDCAPTQATPNDPNGVRATGDRPLTEKLAESGGVLCPPPAVDSDIHVPVPRTGSNMPVVRPPDADPSVKPK